MGKAVIAIHGGAGAISRAQMSLSTANYAYIEPRCLPLLKPGRKCWQRAKVRWMW